MKFFPDNEELRTAGLKSVQGVVNGNITWQKAVKDFQKPFIENSMFTVPYYKKDGTLHAMVNIEDYAKLVARTTSAEAYRQGEENAILEAFDDTGDLVQVIGISQYPNSPCIPYQGAILSLRGITKGYITLDDAKAQGLFHPNCIHHLGVTSDVINEYDRIEAGNSQGTVLNENLTTNPHINGKLVKGRYNTQEVKKLQNIYDIISKNGYTSSGHAIQRIYERNIKPERVLDVINNGKKYSDTKNSVSYYRNLVSVHISKETGQIKTVIRYNKGDKTPNKRK